MKRCFKCNRVKPLDEFYRHAQMADGRLNKCKECNKDDTRANYSKRRSQYQDYDRQRQQNPERRRAKILYMQESRRAHPEKYKARMAVGNAIRCGRLSRIPCQRCGSAERVEAHHHDYSKPLDVTWECFKCHREIEHGQVVKAG